jgi:hypothetical protein
MVHCKLFESCRLAIAGLYYFACLFRKYLDKSMVNNFICQLMKEEKSTRHFSDAFTKDQVKMIGKS